MLFPIRCNKAAGRHRDIAYTKGAAMASDDKAEQNAGLISRRLVLGRFAAASAVAGTFLLSPTAFAQAARHAAAAHSKQGAKPPAPLVMLDPGHGGKDPGAIGLSGTYEKHVALATARELKRQLEIGGRYRVELTRARDVFIPLDERVGRAQRRGAALFVSMHADALPDRTVRGASVYTLANAPSDAQTAALAQKENSADRFLGNAFHGTSPDVAKILASLVRQETRTGSAWIAHALVQSLDRNLPMLPNASRHAGFQVLKAADIPSVLVEMGFMSNAQDEAALRRDGHRKLVADAMKRAVDGWFLATGRTMVAEGRAG
jgi:N-acetylmuramoyl-L-alanine amidase